MIDVLVSGTFCIIHYGHIDLLEYAASLGVVTVGINGDAYLLKKYGKLAVPFEQRKRVIESLIYVKGGVYGFDEPDPSELIRRLRPKIFVRGPDYAGVNLPEQQALSEVGCKLVIQPTIKVASSTRILNELNRS